MDASVLEGVSGAYELKKTRSCLVEELKFLRSTTLKNDVPDLDDTFVRDILGKRVECIEQCMDDVFPVLKYLLWHTSYVYGAVRKTEICKEHTEKESFSFLSQCDKCKNMFKEILRGHFGRTTEGFVFYIPSRGRHVDGKTIIDVGAKPRPVVGTPFKTHYYDDPRYASTKRGDGWKCMTNELGYLIEAMHQLNL